MPDFNAWNAKGARKAKTYALLTASKRNQLHFFCTTCISSAFAFLLKYLFVPHAMLFF